MKKYTFPIIMSAIFETVAITLWLTTDNIFYLFNFTYIGVSVALGIALFIGNRKNGTECILCMECVKTCPKNAL